MTVRPLEEAIDPVIPLDDLPHTDHAHEFEGEMLGDHSRPPGFGRLPTLMAPDEASDEFSAEIDEVADADSLANLPELSDEVIGKLADQLTSLERSLSDRRRQVFDRIDAFQAEIVNRYKTGAADPDQLLT